MTVSSSTNRVNYNGDDSTTVFAYTFKVFDQSDLTVILRSSNGTETVQTITTNYTVSGVGDAGGGNVTMVTAPATGEQLTILREQPLTQGLDLVPNDPFPANSIEESLDKITFMVQKHEEELGRAIKASRTNTISGAEFTVSASDRANKVFAFDSSGDLAVTQELGTFRGDWAASTAYSVRDLVKDTSTNNIFIVNSAHTSSGSQPLTTNANSAKYDLIVDAASATTSATNAATSATASATSATAAATSATAAATSESNAATSASNASTSETNAAASATNAATSESNAAGSESAAATSETNAATSATSASTSASAAATSATNAASSETAAAASQSAAATSETNAATSATSAATNATNAATSETNAATSATNAATSETNAATSATAAAASQTAAANSAAAAAAAFDNFDDTYLGSKTSDPTTDNDGDPLTSGDLYFNSTANEMRVYDGANWIAATSAGNVSLLLYEYTATSGQTTFSGSDDNAATLSYTVNNIQVVMNGVILDPSDYTATSGTSVVLGSGAATGDTVNIYAFKSFTTADMVPASTGGTFAGSVTMSNGLTVDKDGATVLTVDRATSDGTIIDVQRGGTSTAVIGVSAGDDVYFAGATGSSKGIYFNANGLLPATTGGSASDGTVDIGEGITRWKDLYLSGGVYLGGTGASNKLDDYEEGTWTPTFVKSGATITYGGQTGSYTKVGRMVNVTGRIQTNTFSGGSGQIRIGSLPFTAGSHGSDMFAATISVVFGGWGSTDAPSAGFVSPSTTEIKLYAFDSADARNQRDTATSSSGDGSVGLIFSCTYYV
jgi:hypothetical protein